MNNIKMFLDNLIDNSTPNSPSWNKEISFGHIKPSWNYIDTFMIKAILEMYYILEDKKYLNFADNFIDYYINEDGSILGYNKEDFNCDNINGGKVLFDLYSLTGKEKYKKAIYNLYDQILKQPRISLGNFWHKKIYPNQVWLDGLYMVQPFYMEFEMKFNNKCNYQDIFIQFKNVHNIMRDKKSNLLYHGYDDKKECFWADKNTGCSKNFWTRSLGWYAMALVDTIEKLDEQFFYEYEVLQNYLKELVDAILKFCDKKTNMFYQVTDMILKENNYIETSGTCAIAYSIMKGSRKGYLPIYYFKYGEKILKSVIEKKLIIEENNFILKDICLVAGLGVYEGKGNYKLRDGTFEYYISEPIVENDAKGIAAFFLAFSELIRKENENIYEFI